jgi:hypothetical protein
MHFDQDYLGRRRNTSFEFNDRVRQLSGTLQRGAYPFNFVLQSYEELWQSVKEGKWETPRGDEGLRQGNGTERIRIMRHPAWEKGPPRVAFLVSVHNQVSIRGMVSLLETTYNSHDVFIIHVDAKVDFCVRRQLRRYLQSWGDNIFFTQKHVDVQWGHFSIVDMTLELLRTAVRVGRASRDAGDVRYDWDFAVNLCGNTRAVTSTGYRQFLLSQYPPTMNFVGNMTKISKRPNMFYHRTPARCQPSRYNCKSMSHTPGGRLVYKGGQWFVLSRAFSEYLYFDQSLVPRWIRFFSPTRIPDESFFQSVLLASPFRKTLVMELKDRIHKMKLVNPIYTNWEDPCRNRLFHHKPCYLGAEDIVEFTGRKSPAAPPLQGKDGYVPGAIFVRKVPPNGPLDNILLNMLAPVKGMELFPYRQTSS